jgi:hypothetical protein
MLTPEEFDLIPNAITVSHTHSNHFDPEFIDPLTCKNLLQPLKVSMLMMSIYTVLVLHIEGVSLIKIHQTMLYMFLKLMA